MTIKNVCLKKNADRRIRNGHLWIFSNEIDTHKTPLKSFTVGELVNVIAHDSTLLGTAYINPQSLITCRIIGRNAVTSLDTVFFKRYLQEALAFREMIFIKPYYRLVFGESDFLPGLVIDRFGQDFVVQINTAGMDACVEAIADALYELVPETISILLRNDAHVRAQEGLPLEVKPLRGTPPEEVIMEENGVKFSVPLWKGQKTGWFYDHRQNRLRLEAYVKDKMVLDVFSYLGGWAIQAAVFGAKQVDCVETSAFACDYIKRNATLNKVEDKVNVICDDAFDAMKALIQQKKQYDVIILDPPAFVKKLKDRKEGIIAYQRTNELALRLLKPGGILISCSCSMHVSETDLIEIIRRAAYRTQNSVQLLERGHQGPDHPLHVSIPETEYLKAMFVRKMI